VNDDLSATKQKLLQTEQELKILQNQVVKLTEEVAKATTESTAKDATITELRNKEAQVICSNKKLHTNFMNVRKFQNVRSSNETCILIG